MSKDNLRIPSYSEVTKFGDLLKEGEKVGPGIRWGIPEEILPFFDAFKTAHRQKYGRILSRENILLKAVIYGLPGLLDEIREMEQPDTVIVPMAEESK